MQTFFPETPTVFCSPTLHPYECEPLEFWLTCLLTKNQKMHLEREKMYQFWAALGGRALLKVEGRNV